MYVFVLLTYGAKTYWLFLFQAQGSRPGCSPLNLHWISVEVVFQQRIQVSVDVVTALSHCVFQGRPRNLGETLPVFNC